MIIGTFKTNGDVISGSIKTLTFVTEASFEPLETTSDNGPDYRITNGAREFGVAWKKTSEAGNAYYSVQFDDPSFAAPVNCALVKAGVAKSFNLIWDRKRKRD